jgi:hypothetical protein
MEMLAALVAVSRGTSVAITRREERAMTTMETFLVAIAP